MSCKVHASAVAREAVMQTVETAGPAGRAARRRAGRSGATLAILREDGFAAATLKAIAARAGVSRQTVRWWPAAAG